MSVNNCDRGGCGVRNLIGVCSCDKYNSLPKETQKGNEMNTEEQQRLINNYTVLHETMRDIKVTKRYLEELELQKENIINAITDRSREIVNAMYAETEGTEL